MPTKQPPIADWHLMSDPLQLTLAQEAMARSAEIIAEQAELFAVQIHSGELQDRGGAEALQLFAALLRETTSSVFPHSGSA